VANTGIGNKVVCGECISYSTGGRVKSKHAPISHDIIDLNKCLYIQYFIGWVRGPQPTLCGGWRRFSQLRWEQEGMCI